jgi:hypothetical protein
VLLARFGKSQTISPHNFYSTHRFPNSNKQNSTMSLQVTSQPTFAASAPKELQQPQQPQQHFSLMNVWKLKGQETTANHHTVQEAKPLNHILDEITLDTDADDSEHSGDSERSEDNPRCFPYSRQEDWSVRSNNINKATTTALPALSASHPTGVWSNEIESLDQDEMKSLWQAFDQLTADNDASDEGKFMENVKLSWT